MSDVAGGNEVPPKESPESKPPKLRQPQIHNHLPGEHCFFCSCLDCRAFFGRPIRCVDPDTLKPMSHPRYNYMYLVNSMRKAAATREEKRQEKLQADRDGAAAGESPKKGKASKVQPKKKNLRQTMKRRRQ